MWHPLTRGFLSVGSQTAFARGFLSVSSQKSGLVARGLDPCGSPLRSLRPPRLCVEAVVVQSEAVVVQSEAIVGSGAGATRSAGADGVITVPPGSGSG